MGTFSFRDRHNLVISTLDYLSDEFGSNWNSVSVVKSFREVTKVDPPVICVMSDSVDYQRYEVGSTTLKAEYYLIINIFGTSDSQRMDLADFVIDKMKEGFIFYECYNDANHNEVKAANGRVAFVSVDDDLVIEADESTHKNERYRHEIIFKVAIRRA